jgi:hypothetical protein
VEVGLLKGKRADAVRSDKPYRTIVTDDIGACVGLALERPTAFIGKELEIEEASWPTRGRQHLQSRVG